MYFIHALISTTLLVVAFRSPSSSHPYFMPKSIITQIRSKQNNKLYAIDVSGLPVDLSADGIIQSANVQDITTAAQNALILLFGVGYLVAEKRPRGMSKTELLEIKKSSVKNANLGVFATSFIPKGTVVGNFPGYVMSPEAALNSKIDDKARASAKKYMWALQDDVVLDPTNKEGLLELQIPYFFGLYKADTMIARVNEPGRGMDCNIYSKVTAEKVEYIAERDIFAGEELFVDYGSFYDRSAYGDIDEEREQQKQRAIEKAKKRQEEEEMMTLQPVTQSDNDPFAMPDDTKPKKKKINVDQDTSLPDGFLSKLKKRESESLSKSGILSPETAVDMFTTMGSSMFNQKEEDKELIASLTGQQQGNTEKKPAVKKKDKGILSPDDGVSMFGGSRNDLFDALLSDEDDDASRGVSEEKDLLDSLKKQMGKDNLKNMDAIPDVFGATPASKSSKPPAPSSDTSSRPAASAEIKDSETKLMSASDLQDVAIKKPALSVEEAQDLQRRIDQLTDEQVERVFEKMRASLASSAKKDIEIAMEEKRKLSGGRKIMPKAEPTDEEIRKKYSNELTAIEEELENIYNDPLKVWQDIMLNPDKYMTEEEAKELEGLAGDEELQ